MYILVGIVSTGLIPHQKVANSGSPITDAIEYGTGTHNTQRWSYTPVIIRNITSGTPVFLKNTSSAMPRTYRVR